jgi:hypothetical protein
LYTTNYTKIFCGAVPDWTWQHRIGQTSQCVETNVYTSATTGFNYFFNLVKRLAKEDFLKANCKPKKNTGNLCDMTTSSGKILALRQLQEKKVSHLPMKLNSEQLKRGFENKFIHYLLYCHIIKA